MFHLLFKLDQAVNSVFIDKRVSGVTCSPHAWDSSWAAGFSGSRGPSRGLLLAQHLTARARVLSTDLGDHLDRNVT